MRISRIALLFLIGVLMAQTVYYYPNLPEIMASHFDGAGKPNGWMSKNTFFLLEFVVLVLVAGNSALLRPIIGIFPDLMINVPNRDFWLAPERRELSLEKLGRYFDWFSALLLTLFIAVNQTVFNANISKQNLNSQAIWTILISFFIFLIVWMVLLFVEFRIPND